jgi:hypothetical protein
MDIKDIVPTAKDRIELPDGSAILLFRIWNPKFLKDDDPYGPVIRYFYDTGPNRNILKVSPQGELIWRIEEHRQDAPVEDTFHYLEQDNGKIVGTTGFGHRYEIDSDTGAVKLVGMGRFTDDR